MRKGQKQTEEAKENYIIKMIVTKKSEVGK